MGFQVQDQEHQEQVKGFTLSNPSTNQPSTNSNSKAKAKLGFKVQSSRWFKV
jgi:hypothetical protein